MPDKARRVIVSCGTKFHADYMAAQLDHHQLLQKVITAHPPGRFLNRVKLARNKVKFLPPIFLLGYLFHRIGLRSGKLHRAINYRSPLIYDRLAAREVGDGDIVIAWAWSALKTIQKVKSRGGIGILEECGSCNAHQNEILRDAYAELGLVYDGGTPQEIVERELLEVEAADYILCPSDYVAETFIKQGVLPSKCKVIPYGANLSLFRPLFQPPPVFTILFVGTIGVRKGLIYLFRALELLKKGHEIKCILIGQVEPDFRIIFDAYAHLFDHLPRVPHNDLAAYYNKASVFVFPSLDEGMAYVQLEALACGLPVICTHNSGGDTIIEDGKAGFVVPVSDTAAIIEKVTFLYEYPAAQRRMARSAADTAEHFSWDSYGDALAGFIRSL